MCSWSDPWFFAVRAACAAGTTDLQSNGMCTACSTGKTLCPACPPMCQLACLRMLCRSLLNLRVVLQVHTPARSRRVHAHCAVWDRLIWTPARPRLAVHATESLDTKTRLARPPASLSPCAQQDSRRCVFCRTRALCHLHLPSGSLAWFDISHQHTLLLVGACSVRGHRPRVPELPRRHVQA